MPPPAPAPSHTFLFLARSTTHNVGAQRGIGLALGLLFGVSGFILLLVVVCCVRRSKSSSHQEPLFGGERNAGSVEIRRGDEDVSHSKGYRGGGWTGEGCCDFFCAGCCGTAEGRERERERGGAFIFEKVGRRSVILCSTPSGGRGGVPGREGRHPSGDDSRDPGQGPPGGSHRHRGINPHQAPATSPDHHGGGTRGNVYTSISTRINILPPLLPTERLGRSTHRHPSSSRRRPRSLDGRRTGAQDRGRPYPVYTRTGQQIETPSDVPTHERGHPRSFSPDTNPPPVPDRPRHRRRELPERAGGEPVVPYPEAAYRGSGWRSSSSSDREIRAGHKPSLSPWRFRVFDTPVPAHVHFTEDKPSATSAVYTLGRGGEGHGADVVGSGSRTRDKTREGAPILRSVGLGDSGIELEHPGSLVDFTAGAPISDSTSSSSSSLGSDTIRAYPRNEAPPDPEESISSTSGTTRARYAVRNNSLRSSVHGAPAQFRSSDPVTPHAGPSRRIPKNSPTGTAATWDPQRNTPLGGSLAGPYGETPSRPAGTVAYALPLITDSHSVPQVPPPVSNHLSAMEPITDQLPLDSHTASKGSSISYAPAPSPPEPSHATTPSSESTQFPATTPSSVAPPSIDRVLPTPPSATRPRFVTAPSSIYSDAAGEDAVFTPRVPAMLVVSPAARTYWATVESVPDTGEM